MTSHRTRSSRQDPQAAASGRATRRLAWIAGLTASVALAGSLTGCAAPAPAPQSTNAAGSVAAAPTSGATLTATAFADAIKLPNTVVIDVRTPAEFAAGHLAGAQNIDVEAANFSTKIASLDKSATYALYCRSGNRSKTALATMQKAGFGKVFHLGGGITAWTTGGGSVTTG